ncbi:MAG: hypothetical protein ACLFQ5_12270 [Oceanicaulis sp.]
MTGNLTGQQRLMLAKHRRQIQQRIARGEIDFFGALDAIKTIVDPDHEPKGQILTMEMRGMLQMVFDQLEGRLARGLVGTEEALAELELLANDTGDDASMRRSVA